MNPIRCTWVNPANPRYLDYHDREWGSPCHDEPRLFEQGERPAKTALSDLISKDLAKRGFKFVGSTIIYAYMQSIGMVDDHDLTCFCRAGR